MVHTQTVTRREIVQVTGSSTALYGYAVARKYGFIEQARIAYAAVVFKKRRQRRVSNYHDPPRQPEVAIRRIALQISQTEHDEEWKITLKIYRNVHSNGISC